MNNNNNNNMDTAAAATHPTDAAAAATSKIEIPDCLKKFPGMQKINHPVVCGKKKGKYSKDCGCVALLKNSGGVTQIRLEYLASLESDVKRGLDWSYVPDANPAGAFHIQQFMIPVATAKPTNGKKSFQRFKYNILVAGSNSTLYPNICPQVFEQIFCLNNNSLQKIRNDMMGKPTAPIPTYPRPSRAKEKKDGVHSDEAQAVLLNVIVPEQTKTILQISKNGNIMILKRVTFVKNFFDGWIQLLSTLGNDTEFLEEANKSGFYPTYTSKTAQQQQQQQPQPSITYKAFHYNLEKIIVKEEVLGELNKPRPQRRRLTRSSSTRSKAAKNDDDDDDDVTLLITGNGIYMEDLNFQSDEGIRKAYGRCQQCKILRTLDKNVIEVSFNILTPITYFNDLNHNYRNLYGTLFDSDDDPVPGVYEDLGKWGGTAFKWLKEEKLNGRRIKDIHFVGVGFTRNGGGLRIFMTKLITYLMNQPSITVVDNNPMAHMKNGSIETQCGVQNLGIKYVTATAESYLKKLITERTKCYDDVMMNATYPTTNELNTAFATPHPTNPGEHIQRELPPLNDNFIDDLWVVIKTRNNYSNPFTTRTLRSGSSKNSRGGSTKKARIE